MTSDRRQKSEGRMQKEEGRIRRPTTKTQRHKEVTNRSQKLEVRMQNEECTDQNAEVQSNGRTVGQGPLRPSQMSDVRCGMAEVLKQTGGRRLAVGGRLL